MKKILKILKQKKYFTPFVTWHLENKEENTPGFPLLKAWSGLRRDEKKFHKFNFKNSM
jgi:hypothetical protein